MWIINCICNKEELSEYVRVLFCLFTRRVIKLSNYRGILRLSTTYRSLYNILQAILTPYVHEVTCSHQFGFRRNRSYTDQIFFIRQMME